MPLFTYHCLACDKTYDDIVRNSEVVSECPFCASKDTKRDELAFGTCVTVYDNKTSKRISRAK